MIQYMNSQFNIIDQKFMEDQWEKKLRHIYQTTIICLAQIYIMTAYNTNITSLIPNTYKEAINFAVAEHWKSAIDAKISIIKANNTRTIKPLPTDDEEIKGRWVFTVKQVKQLKQIQHK